MGEIKVEAEGRVIVLEGVPQPKQEQFFLADTRHVAYGGARGGGKSWSLRRKLVLRCLTYPGSKALLLRRTYPELLTNHVNPLRLELKTDKKDGLAKYNSTEKVFTFLNGSTLRMGYAEHEADIHRFQGDEYDTIGLEEATTFTEYQANFIRTCLRTVRTDLEPRMYYTANPGGVGHMWFKRLFIDKDYTDKENPADYTFIQATVFDNKILLDADSEYLGELQKLPDDLRRAYLDGDWDVFAGQYFKNFRRNLHVVNAAIIPPWHRRFRSLDYGLDTTACYWHSVDGEGNILTYRELYEPGLTLSQAAKAILAETPGNEVIDYTVASPDLWNRRQETGVSGFEVMREAGLADLIPADNQRVAGWRLMLEYLEPFHDPNIGQETARWRIASDCGNLITTLPIAMHDTKNPEDVALENDHGIESCRYALMSRPPISEKPVRPKTVIEADKARLVSKARRRRRTSA